MKDAIEESFDIRPSSVSISFTAPYKGSYSSTPEVQNGCTVILKKDGVDVQVSDVRREMAVYVGRIAGVLSGTTMPKGLRHDEEISFNDSHIWSLINH